MKHYFINEIFYSLQGEGRWAGRAAIFIRFSGCNLKCPFCDTNFKENKSMTADEILQVIEYWKDCHFVVLTGGEPTLQVDEELIDRLHWKGYFVAMETNGTRPAPKTIDWITYSPKQAYVSNAAPQLKRADEIKVVYDGDSEHEPKADLVTVDNYYIQPCDTGDEERNKKILAACVEWVKQHPMWKLSLQTQKILNVR